ncbi:MAG TPA: hypothetical protein VHB21_22255 [Minicystis sp.]|nr:hypothetical protein [Minicystis sp.]
MRDRSSAGRTPDDDDDSRLGPNDDRASSPRAALVAALADAVKAASAAGDLHAARVAVEALARLVDVPAPGGPEIADLSAERARRR